MSLAPGDELLSVNDFLRLPPGAVVTDSLGTEYRRNPETGLWRNSLDYFPTIKWMKTRGPFRFAGIE